MNVHDEMSDDEVLRAAERSLSAIPMAMRPDARVIMARGRARRRRRLTGLGVAGTAAAAVAALSVAGVFGGGSGSMPSAHRIPSPPIAESSPSSCRTATRYSRPARVRRASRFPAVP